MSVDKNYWWSKAKEASALVGWFPTVILAQWQLETGAFTSNNLLVNNNIAGQTWTAQYPESMKGTARPAKEGGYYVRYDDPVEGYIDFISRNSRYKGVCQKQTEIEQIQEIAACGWAADKNYAANLISVLKGNWSQGFILEEDDEMLKEQVTQLESLVENLQGQCQTLLKTAEAHIEKINVLEKQASMPVPDWAAEAVKKAIKAQLIEKPDGGSYDFYRLLTVLYRKGLI
ncbi:glucosaminidase domain-containing protein [Paenibacillus sp. TAB 01]|uniref:glucosaminidase domain-containing protein n=1 Tax=Paenibacillus sp. TAB 01 TaxID=3368988 RepID=UPI00375348CC